jgi:hypothetical protein
MKSMRKQEIIERKKKNRGVYEKEMEGENIWKRSIQGRRDCKEWKDEKGCKRQWIRKI